MKERPILFSAPMVIALLSSRKTMTRRIVKPQPEDCMVGITGLFRHPNRLGKYIGETERVLCPYGKPGDRLWVRETWRIGAWNENSGGEIAVDYLADNHSRRDWLQVPDADTFEKYWLQSCDDCDKAGIKTDGAGQYHWEPGQSPCRTRPSIFMPRWASRILLEITNVRVERLQDISEEDAMAEGVQLLKTQSALDRGVWAHRYAQLWETINGHGSWDVNPWVWVIEFKVVTAQ